MCITISTQICERIKQGTPGFDKKIFSCCFLPLEFQLKKIFEIPGVLEMSLQSINDSLQQEIITNFINGDVFKSQKINFSNFDDFGINNPLGAHNKSITAAYYSLPTLPQQVKSKLDFIFHIGYINSSDIKTFGNEKIFYHLIHVLKNLEDEGVEIVTPGKTQRIYFTVGVVLGDNLGLNSVLGFVKSFNSKRFCRICQRERSERQEDVCEIVNSLRKQQYYKSDLLLDDFKETGVRGNCIFNDLKAFHVTENISLDFMHDLFEGVCIYDICNVLIALTKNKTFSLSIFNSRRRLFPYGEDEVGNKGPDILQRA